jgi:hypothetical protein
MGNKLNAISEDSTEAIKDGSNGKKSRRMNCLPEKIEQLYLQYGYDRLSEEKMNKLMEDYMVTGLWKKFEMNKEDGDFITDNKLKVKFIVSYRHVSKAEKLCGGLLALFQKTYGPVHTCIQIGPYVLHWYNNSLVKVDSVKSTNSLLALDVAVIDIDRNVSIKRNSSICKIIELAANYNMFKKYDLITCNCQHFVDDILKILGINSLKDCFSKKEKMQNVKKVEEFRSKIPNEELRQIFDSLKAGFLFDNMIKAAEMLFETHVDLDRFTKYIINCAYRDDEPEEALRKFSQDCPVKYDILKSCDRAFWLRLENDLDNMDSTAIDNESHAHLPLIDAEGMCQCAFESPLITGTMPQGHTRLIAHSYTKLNITPSNKNPLRILNLCGTGLRSVAILAMLNKIEKDTKMRIYELFNIVTGTSISGVIALALSQGIPLSNIEKFFDELCHEKNVIPVEFGDNILLKKDVNIRKDFYNTTRLEECIEDLFGRTESRTLLNQCKKDILAIIPAMKISASKRNMILLSQNIKSGSFTLGDAARLSMSQVQYFGNTTIDNISYHSAVESACNPIEHILVSIDGQKEYSGRKISIVSLGGGRLKPNDYRKAGDFYQFMLHQKPSDVIHSTFATHFLNRESHISLMRWILSTQARHMVQYYRFDPLTNYVDDALNRMDNKELFAKLREEAENYLQNENKFYNVYLEEVSMLN